MHVNVSDTLNDKFISEFLADSGATEHQTNSKLTVETFDEKNVGLMKCPNKNQNADLRTEGVGQVEVELSNGKKYAIDEVISAEALQANLLSLRRFGEMGLAIYLDDKQIDIFGPDSNESFIRGAYSKPTG